MLQNAVAARWDVDYLVPAQDPEDVRRINVALTPATSGQTYQLAKGTILGEITATPGIYVAYDDDGTDDGRRVARGILENAVVVDDAGNITFTATAGQKGGEWGQTQKYAPMIYRGGVWKTAELTGLDANGVADLQACVIQGDLSSGLLRL